MKRTITAWLLACVAAAAAAQAERAEDLKQDIARHRAMAAAHQEMARCLESGQKPDACLVRLGAACKGLAIGKYCGMKHQH